MSDLDQDLLLFVAAHEVALARQAAALLQITEDEAVDRLETLRSERLLARVLLSSVLPPAYRPTRRGAEQVDSCLPPVRALDWHRYRHEIATAWLWVSARHGQLGNLREVLTRREMQAADATLRTESLLDTPGATFAYQTPAGSQTDAYHDYPDLALVQASGGWAALDVLLTMPEPQCLRTLLGRTLRHAQMLAQLILIDQDQAIDGAVEAAAAELGVTDRIHIQHLAPDGIDGA